MKKSIILTILFYCLLPTNINAQEVKNQERETKLEYFQKRFIEIEDSNKNKRVYLDIKPDTKYFKYNIETKIYAGELSIEIFNPNNDEMGKFVVKSEDKSTKREPAKGIMNLILNEPLEGKWLILIKPKNATGNITMSRKNE